MDSSTDQINPNLKKHNLFNFYLLVFKFRIKHALKNVKHVSKLFRKINQISPYFRIIDCCSYQIKSFNLQPV